MPTLTCPECRTERDARDTEAFAVRGRLPDGHWPVRKCCNCGAGLVVRPRLGVLIFWPKAEAIHPETWRQMERYWREKVELRCPRCRKTFATQRALDDHLAAKHGRRPA